MVNPDNKNAARSSAQFQRKDISNPKPFSSRKSSNDDLIGALANAYENKRARQVSEWERINTVSVHRSV